MKKVALALLMAASGCMLLPACTKSSSNPAKSLSATIGGVSVTWQNIITTDSTGFVGINGTNTTGTTQKSLTFLLESYNNKTGVYPIGTSSGGTYSDLYYNDDTKTYLGVSGSAVVTTATSKSAIGTFTAVLISAAKDTIQITDGKFSTYWQ
ncbi:MAG: hypothetical protein P4L41_15850 [Flavipsychrobacter sp.]|nr:hypothetical protein [Flavipsychrobacter sp.]